MPFCIGGFMSNEKNDGMCASQSEILELSRNVSVHGIEGMQTSTSVLRLVQEIFGTTLQTETDSASLRFEPKTAYVALSIQTYLYQDKRTSFGKMIVQDTALKMSRDGVRTHFLGVSLILEGGCPIELLTTILRDMQEEAQAQHLEIVTFDTKLVASGDCSKVIVTLVGLGEHHSRRLNDVNPSNMDPSSDLVCTGDGENYSAVIEEFSDQNIVDAHVAIIPFDPGNPHVSFTTSGYVVDPIIFPGGDIGKLAILGVLNDVVVGGARPLFLVLSIIIERGFSENVFRDILRSIYSTAKMVSVPIVKIHMSVVLPREVDGIYIVASGIGEHHYWRHPENLHPKNIRPKDHILLSADIGRHGMALLQERLNMSESADSIRNDLYSLHREGWAMMVSQEVDVVYMKNLTAGGLVRALNKIALATHMHLQIIESALLISEAVRDSCQKLDLDPKFLACQGKMVVIVRPHQSAYALKILHQNGSPDAVHIGEVVSPLQVDMLEGFVSCIAPDGAVSILGQSSSVGLNRVF